MSQPSSPFKFLDSYQFNDRDIFFGRDKEIDDLYNALSGVKHLLVYGPSGSGKTSLVECGLRNQFSDADWFALTIRRGLNINASFFNTLNEILHKKIEIDSNSRLPKDETTNFGEAIEKLFTERYQPVYLLFDQFEELLILGSSSEKKDFFNRLNQLIRYKVPCRVILIMREEFIGYLSEFEPLCPTIFQHRFRLEKMGKSNVKGVIFKMLNAPRYKDDFEVENSEQLCDDILSKLPDIKHEIELAHLQVFLGELWDRAYKIKKDRSLPVLTPGLIDEKDNLQSVLDIFLNNQFDELEKEYGEGVPLEILAAMITERNTKLQMSEEDLQKDLESKKVISKKPLSSLLKDLENRRIIRPLKANEMTQYEITHDILALVVGQNRTNEMKERVRAQDIYEVYKDRQGDFTLDDLNLLHPFEKYFPTVFITRIRESEVFIKQNEEKKLKETQRRLRIVGSLLIFAVIALITAGYFWFNANKQKKDADKQREVANNQSKIAFAERNNANKALADYQSSEFRDLENKATTVVNADICPREFLRKMDSLAAIHPDSVEMRERIKTIKTQSVNFCK